MIHAIELVATDPQLVQGHNQGLVCAVVPRLGVLLCPAIDLPYFHTHFLQSLRKFNVLLAPQFKSALQRQAIKAKGDCGRKHEIVVLAATRDALVCTFLFWRLVVEFLCSLCY